MEIILGSVGDGRRLSLRKIIYISKRFGPCPQGVANLNANMDEDEKRGQRKGEKETREENTAFHKALFTVGASQS